MLRVMGPKVAHIAAQCGAPELTDLGYLRQTGAHLAGVRLRATGLSYVGEAGWELHCKAGNAPALARTSLRPTERR